MIRATPYWSVSPSAVSAYMPPRMSPDSRISSARVIARYLGSAGRRFLLPTRLRNDRRHGAVLGDRSKAHELAALPLADGPDVLVLTVHQLDLADDGVELAGVDLLDDRGAVDLADALDRLLQHLEARVGDRARPAV